VLQVAVKALPYREEFLRTMAGGECDTSSPQFSDTLMSDMELFLKHMNTIILVIGKFYSDEQLDIQEQV
jgi:hypothetical protein